MLFNRRHKVGLFVTIVGVGSGLLFDESLKVCLGLGLLGLAGTWAIGSIPLKMGPSVPVAEAPKPLDLPDGANREPVPVENVSANKGSSRGSWIWLVVSLTAFTFLLAIGIFNLTWQSVSGDHEKAGESLGQLLIPLIALGLWARSSWRSVLAREPESDAAYRRRHHRFNLVAGVLSIALLSTSLVYGVLTGDRVEKRKRINALLSDIEKLSPKNRELRTRITSLLSENTPTFQDYYLRCIRLEKILDEYDEQQQRVHPLLDRLLSEAADQPKVVGTVRAVQRINEKDSEVVKLFRLEIAKSKDLMDLPSSQQVSFYRQQIIPIENQATAAANEEIAMMRDAEKSGLEWPSDLKALLKGDPPK